MSLGAYATVRPATVDPRDVDILYCYAPDRFSAPGPLTRLNATEVLTALLDPDAPSQVIGGLYRFRLPASLFNKVGVYTVYMRPREYRVAILDCGVLAALPDHKGLILDTAGLDAGLATQLGPGAMAGWRIEYIDPASGARVPNQFTVVAHSARAEPVAQNLGNTTQKSITYRFNEAGSLLFLSVLPGATTAAVIANQQPTIGVAGQEILLTSPYVDAQQLEIELTQYDVESLAIAMFGDQTRSVQDGVVTYYKRLPDGTREIYRQHSIWEIKDEYNEQLFEVKEVIDTPDPSKDWGSITENVETT